MEKLSSGPKGNIKIYDIGKLQMSKRTSDISPDKEKQEDEEVLITIGRKKKEDENDPTSEESKHNLTLRSTRCSLSTTPNDDTMEKAIQSQKDKFGYKDGTPENILLIPGVSDQIPTKVMDEITEPPFILNNAAPDTLKPKGSREKTTPSRKSSGSEFSDETLSSGCRNCKGPIVLNEELMGRLVKERERPSKSDATKTILTISCRICDRGLQEGFVKHHLRNHALEKELYYCVKCQRMINDIMIEGVPDPEQNKHVIKKDGTFFPLLETRKVELSGILTTDPSVEPRCGKCGMILDYVRPLLYKMLDSTINIYRTESSPISVESCYTCRLCGKYENSLHKIQCHALEHVKRGDVICKFCREEDTSKSQ